MELDVKPRKIHIYRYLGIGNSKGIPIKIEGMIEKGIKEALEMVEFKYHYKYLDDYHLIKEVGLDSSLFGNSNINGYFLFIITIGDKLEEYSAALMDNGNYTMATIIDSIGTELVENGAQALENLIKENNKGKGPFTERVSPGYGNWDISYQREIFNLLEVDFVTLTSSLMMKPQKSITAAFGSLNKEGDIAIDINKCTNCNLADCKYRGV